MPIGLKDYINLQEKKPKSNSELLKFMDAEQAYTTTDIEKFLQIQHPAALSRLKRLYRMGYIEMKVLGKHHYWRKVKDWPEENKPIDVIDPMSSTGSSIIRDTIELNTNDSKDQTR